ncbi:MAG: DNA translocase FtsK 4TM domain-containing protein, partial [Anaerolineae bacterium]
MAVRKSSRKTTKKTQRSKIQVLGQREFWAVVLLIASVITLITLLFSGQGLLGAGWAATLRQIFGQFGAFIMALIWLSGALALLAWENLEPHFHPRWQSVVGWSLAFFGVEGFLHLSSRIDPLVLALSGKGGGYLGYLVSLLILPWFGRAAGLVLVIIVFLLGVMLALGVRWQDTTAFFKMAGLQVVKWLKTFVSQLRV